MPEKASLYAIPYEYYGEVYSIRRYGFHGTSHSYVSKEAIKYCELDPETAKVIVCHLGTAPAYHLPPSAASALIPAWD